MPNLAEALGQPCQQNWRGYVTDLNVQQQLTAATNLPIGEGYLQRGGVPRRVFPILCLKGVYVIESRVTPEILKIVERWVRQPVPWARVLSAGNGSWCGPSYVCSSSNAELAARCGSVSNPYTLPYPPTMTAQQTVCLPQFNYTQRRDGRADDYCWNQSNLAWADFWRGVGDAIRRFNAGEAPLR